MVFTRSLEMLGEWLQVELPGMTHRISPPTHPELTKGAVTSAAVRKLAPRFLLQEHSASVVYITSKINATNLTYHFHESRD